MLDRESAEVKEKVHGIMKKAAHEESYKKLLLSNPHEVFLKEGVSLDRNIVLEIHENTKSELHIVVPEKNLPENLLLKKMPKKSSYHHITLWVITHIQTNSSLKNDLLKTPQDVLKKEGAKIPDQMKLVIHLDKNDHLHFVIPRKVQDGEELNGLDIQEVVGGGY